MNSHPIISFFEPPGWLASMSLFVSSLFPSCNKTEDREPTAITILICYAWPSVALSLLFIFVVLS